MILKVEINQILELWFLTSPSSLQWIVIVVILALIAVLVVEAEAAATASPILVSMVSINLGS